MPGAFFPGRFAGKRMVITGAAQGIGLAVAMRAALEGGQVLLVDRADFLPEVLAEIAALTGERGRLAGQIADLESYDGATKAMAAGVQAFGGLDIIINAVGGTIWAKPYGEYAPDEISAEIQRSLFPTLWSCRAALPHLLANGGGVIVNISSVATRGVNRAPYAAAKGGVNALTQALAMDYASAGIRVIATAPGGTDAPPRRVPRNPRPQSPQEVIWYRAIVDQTIESSFLKRYGTLAEQVAPILFLASDEASYITASTLPVAGGDLG